MGRGRRLKNKLHDHFSFNISSNRHQFFITGGYGTYGPPQTGHPPPGPPREPNAHSTTNNNSANENSNANPPRPSSGMTSPPNQEGRSQSADKESPAVRTSGEQVDIFNPNSSFSVNYSSSKSDWNHYINNHAGWQQISRESRSI